MQRSHRALRQRVELRTLRGRYRLARATIPKRDARIVLHAVDKDFEVQVWGGGQPRHPYISDCLPDRHPRAAMDARREA